MKRRGLRIALTVLLGLGGAFYFLFIGRAHEHLEKNGWVLDWSYVRVACRTCSGNIERLEYGDAPIHPPALKPEAGRVMVYTPVGGFVAYPEEQWRYSTPALAMCATAPALAEEEIERGWYEASEPRSSLQLSQRQGTPAHWAFVLGHQGGRWCEPRLIGECAVAVSQPPKTQTSPAE